MQDIGNWRGLCTNLKVDPGIMNALVYSTEHYDTKKLDCLQAYLDSGHARWSEVVSAVAKPPIRNKRIARIIAKDHGIDFDEKKDEL